VYKLCVKVMEARTGVTACRLHGTCPCDRPGDSTWPWPTDARLPPKPPRRWSVAGTALMLLREGVGGRCHHNHDANQSAGAVVGDGNGVLASHRGHAYGTKTSEAERNSNATKAAQSVIVAPRRCSRDQPNNNRFSLPLSGGCRQLSRRWFRVRAGIRVRDSRSTSRQACPGTVLNWFDGFANGFR
jgi:hypothetical protein